MERLGAKLGVMLLGSYIIADILTHGQTSIALGGILATLFKTATQGATGQTVN